jgi:hypothetical protein
VGMNCVIYLREEISATWCPCVQEA